jgi:hypothetical protein
MVFGQIGREMTDEEVEDVLCSAGHGLLSLANQSTAYGIPMSYGYETDSATFVMEFLFQPGSRKRTFLFETTEASMCVYRWEDRSDWYSVIASGPMYRVDDEERIREMATVLGEQSSDIAPWWLRFSSTRDRERAWCELDATSVVGICAD